VNLYHWTWDAIGGGSGFWYHPVWWMGSAFLSGLGALRISYGSAGEENASVAALLPRLGVVTAVLFAVIVGTGLFPPTSAVVALSFSVGLLVDAMISAVRSGG
jgi:hypothetical protein